MSRRIMLRKSIDPAGVTQILLFASSYTGVDAAVQLAGLKTKQPIQPADSREFKFHLTAAMLSANSIDSFLVVEVIDPLGGRYANGIHHVTAGDGLRR